MRAVLLHFDFELRFFHAQLMHALANQFIQFFGIANTRFVQFVSGRNKRLVEHVDFTREC
ncbi:Uncharacterised protein [Vibrio cholerae]|nr:Uncharacterised protein [Vibrio cholerae]CSC95458.1 Uncharacterised protein [Vibrio cholerae]